MLATPEEIAKYLHTTPAKLSQDRYMKRGLPYVKDGHRVLYRWADVRAYIEARVVQPQDGGAA